MNAFLRQMAVLGILTTLAEHLLPEGGLRKAGRMVMGLLMMLTILTSLLDILKEPLPDIAGIARSQQKAELALLHEPGSYRDTVLLSLQRQVQSAAGRAAQSAGLADATALAELTSEGEILAIRLQISTGAVSAFSGGSLEQADYQNVCKQVAQALSISESLVRVEAGGDPN